MKATVILHTRLWYEKSTVWQKQQPQFVNGRVCVRRLTTRPTARAAKVGTVEYAKFDKAKKYSEKCTLQESNSTKEFPTPNDAPVLLSWDLAQLMVQIWSVILPLGYGGIPTAARLLGADVYTLPYLIDAILADLNEGIQIIIVLAILQSKPAAKSLTQSAARAPCKLKKLLIGFGGGIGSFVIIQLFMNSTQSQAMNGAMQDLFRGSGQAATAAFLFAVGILAPVLEEIVYRAFLLQALMPLMPTPAAVLLSSAAFAVAHFSSSNAVLLTILGVCFASTFLASNRSIASSTIAHVVYNFLVYCTLDRN